MTIHYVQGDATQPDTSTAPHHVIMHICNNKGGWGRGFVMALSARWPEPEAAYRAQRGFHVLGSMQVVAVDQGLHVANLVAQDTYGRHCLKRRCVSYSALRLCLHKLALSLDPETTSLHCPRMGTNLGGGKWSEVEQILSDELSAFDVTVYDLPQ